MRFSLPPLRAVAESADNYWLPTLPLTRESLKPGYALLGDEIFFRDRFRKVLLDLLVPADLREYSVFDEDLAGTPLDEILNRARNSSLMTPVQVFFIRNVKDLFGRGAARSEGSSSSSRRKHGNFPENLGAYMADPNPDSVLVFIADHIHIPVDPRRISLDDKSKLKRIEETLGKSCEIFVCARVPERQGAEIAQELAAAEGVTIEPDATRLLLELVGGDLGMVSSELAKLSLHAGKSRRISARDVRELVRSAQQSSAYQVAAMIAANDRCGALDALRCIWAAEGDAVGIPLVFQLSRAFKMALLLKEKGVRDRGMLYSSLPEGLRPPTFAVDDLLSISRRMSLASMQEAIQSLQRIDVALRSVPLSARLLFEQLVLELTAATAALDPWRQEVFAGAGG